MSDVDTPVKEFIPAEADGNKQREGELTSCPAVSAHNVCID